ncbi:MAG: polynucleotide adenylyltransferase PcnB [Chromatiaceae bacterium]|nr:polynucleotide adenylyltransferase PcnB [Chromatiaceae bacterium]MCP5314439.1 polynucleotide adenylyltransferase PcnB [Chromatiaceae bacterium]
MTQPVVIPRDQHTISRANISPNALKVLYRLKAEGFAAHLVGGGVRDLLLGREPKDFDVATDARPEQVREVFRNCRLIGRRFRLAHVHFGQEIIEVATFRAGQDGEENGNHQTDEGMLLRDNVYGTIEQDALRRDFTVNALYYNIADFSIIDYAGGVEDLQAGVLRLLGDPETRYREDPVRMLRAVRFAAKLGFRIDDATAEPIVDLASLLGDIPPARLFEEIQKLFLYGTAVGGFEKLRQYGLFAHLFPATEGCLAQLEHEFPLTLVLKGLENTDQRLREGKSVTPAFLFAVLLWEPVRQRAERLQAGGEAPYQAISQAAAEVVARQLERIALPRRFSTPMQEIWTLQPRFNQTRGKRPQRLMAHPRFRAAYDFLLLRAAAGEADADLAAWWTALQGEGGGELPPPDKPTARRRSRRGRRGRRRSKEAATEE